MKKNLLLLALCLLLLLSGCAGGETTAEKTVFAMDTLMTLTARGKQAQEAVSAAESELFRLDALLNRHSETSAVAILNQTGSIENAELAALLQRSGALTEETGGTFDCTVAPIIDAWDIAGGGRIPSDEELQQALDAVGFLAHVQINKDTITLTGRSAVDLGGLGKGYAAEQIQKTYREYGVTGSADLGGDICLIGAKSGQDRLWRIGLKAPGGNNVLASLQATDLYVVTSGSYERYFTAEDGTVYHHILNPITGFPAESGLVSVTVLCADGVRADALATAFFIMGVKQTKEYLAAHSDVAAVLVTGERRVLYSRSLEENNFSPLAEGYSYEAF